MTCAFGLVGLHASSACMPMGMAFTFDIQMWCHTPCGFTPCWNSFFSAIDKVIARDRQTKKTEPWHYVAIA